MNWKSILPQGVSVNDLSFKECQHFKKLHERLNSLTSDVKGPKGYRIFFELMHYLLFYGLACIQENKFPALNRCWDKLSPLFLTDSYDSEWLVHCWIFCDFPLNQYGNEVLLDDFCLFMLANPGLKAHLHEYIPQFCSIMKASRLGLYQEILSTSKVTKYKELFTNKAIRTVRSIPYYESGEIFLTRIVSFLGDTFTIHDARSFPPMTKSILEGMVTRKLSYIVETKDTVADYEQFMKLAGPYWMSCTHSSQSIDILNPDEYRNYY